jgi:hypothetical protein
MYQPVHLAQPTVQAVIRAFHTKGYSYTEIGLLVSAHAGHLVRKSTISALANGRTSGRNLAPAFYALSRAWGLYG